MTPTTAYVRFGADGVAEVQAHLRLTASTHIRCCTYPDGAPILTLDDAPVSVSVTVPDRDEKVTAADVATARKLADAVAAYVAELEKRAVPAGESAADPGRAA